MNAPLLIPFGNGETVSMPVVGIAYCGTTGFQSPADDYIEERIDLAKELVTNRPSTFCWRLGGQSFVKMGIPDGAIGVFDYSLKPQPGDVVLLRLHDVITVKIVKSINGRYCLTSASDGYPVIPINEEEGVQIFGVLIDYVVQVRRARAR